MEATQEETSEGKTEETYHSCEGASCRELTEKHNKK